ncbi:DUF262 domain-containing protein [Burkholderia gladioli]|uniref:DUF262 domain-containing protein n=1 Tax=Burkholderia gladioli TaxID=28095 RepID=UPI00164024E6|nr:DUF262 domain-containing protein [Burkholderia gladioli]
MATKLTDKELENLYDAGDFKIVQERNDFLLPQITDFIKKDRWVNIRPEYQRRLVWDRTKKSRLIESLLMNVPVPPIFLFEHDLNRYEVMDGQQRLNAIMEFYTNRFKLHGLEKWDQLNGKSYGDLPPRIQRGLDRRRISATVLMSESTSSNDQAQSLRRLVFERLNTGGQSLNAQELRNSMYSGLFNDLIIELSGLRTFNEMWDVPPYEENIRGEHISKELAENRLFKRMGDCEIVLRFFAFSDVASKIKGSVKIMLDRCMKEFGEASEAEIHELRNKFIGTLNLTYEIFGSSAFVIPASETATEKHSAPLYDAIMVALHRLKSRRNELLGAAEALRDALATSMADPDFFALIVGRANTAESIKQRIKAVEDLFVGCLHA